MPELTPEQKQQRDFVVEPNAGVLLPLLGLVAAAAIPAPPTKEEKL